MKWAVPSALLIAWSPAAAEEVPICAARPGKATPACTVPAGHFQLETGIADWAVTKDTGVRATTLAVGETVFKLGLTSRSDLEVDVTPWQRAKVESDGADESHSGFGDIVVAYKHRLTRDDAALQVAALPSVKIPTADHFLGNRKVEASLLLPVSYSIAGSRFSIGATPELDWNGDLDGHGHHAGIAQVVTVGWAATDRLSLSGELWGQWNWDPAATVKQYSADASVAYLVGDDVQLDAGANFGLNRATPDVEVYAGVSKRF
jgi:outer membrane putative beta-barrel porin/alpha-amylase